MPRRVHPAKKLNRRQVGPTMVVPTPSPLPPRCLPTGPPHLRCPGIAPGHQPWCRPPNWRSLACWASGGSAAPIATANSRKSPWPGSLCKLLCTRARALLTSPRRCASCACRNVSSGPPSAGCPVSLSMRSSASESMSLSMSKRCHSARFAALSSNSRPEGREPRPVSLRHRGRPGRGRRGSSHKSRSTCR